MTDNTMWQGYLIQSNGDNHFINSPWKLGDECVFGYDSDYTTMAISLIRYLSIEKPKLSLSSIDERINQQTVIAATQIEVNPSGYKIKCNDDASLQVYIGDEGVFHLAFDSMQDIDEEKYSKIANAWQNESNIMNTSQGAYISGQQYDESLESRLSLVAQNHQGIIWPQRQMDSEGTNISQSYLSLIHISEPTRPY